MTREDKNTFLFRPTVLVEEVQRVVCLTESAALHTFLDYLEKIGPNVILVGLDEDTLGVLMQKLKGGQGQDRARFLKQVDGFTWWMRILKYFGIQDYKNLSLEEFYKSTFSPPPGPPLTSALVAERLMQAVQEVALRQGFFSTIDVGEQGLNWKSNILQDVALPVQTRARVKQRNVTNEEVLEVTNSYLSIPVTSFAVSRMEQVDLQDQDQDAPINISSDSADSEDMSQPPGSTQCRMSNITGLSEDALKLKSYPTHTARMASERESRKRSRKSRKTDKTVPASPSCFRSRTRSLSRSRTRSPDTRSPSSSRSKSPFPKKKSRSPTRSKSPRSPGEKSKNRRSRTRSPSSRSRTRCPDTRSPSRSRSKSPCPKKRSRKSRYGSSLPGQGQGTSARSHTRFFPDNSSCLSWSSSKGGRRDDDSRPRLKGKQRMSPKTKFEVCLPKGAAAMLRESHRILSTPDINVPKFDLSKLESNLTQMPCSFFQFGRCSHKNVMAHQDTDSRARVHVHACSLCYRMTKVMFPHNLYKCPFASISEV